MNDQHKILVIDDEISICRGCQRIFEEEGHSIKFALSGREGLEQVDTEVFDVAIIDLKMPDIDGIEVMRTIRRKQPNLAMIMITGYASVPTAVEAIKVGADDFIPKPFTPDEILTVVNKVLERIPGREAPEAADMPAPAAAEPAPEPASFEPDSGYFAFEADPEPEPVIRGDHVLQVLNRAIRDVAFFTDFLDHSRRPTVLGDCVLSSEAAAAITSGDIQWLERNAGALTPEQREFLMRRLCVEAW